MNKKLYSFMILLILFYSHNTCTNTLENQQIENTKTTRNGWFNKKTSNKTRTLKKNQAQLRKSSRFISFIGCLFGLVGTIIYSMMIYTTIEFLSYTSPRYLPIPPLATSMMLGGMFLMLEISLFSIFIHIYALCTSKTIHVLPNTTKQEIKKTNSPSSKK